MEFVITFLANPKKALLPEDFLNSMAVALAAQAVRWPAPGEACEMRFSAPSREEADKALGGLLAAHPFDAIVQPYPKPCYRLFAADMESTLVACEYLDELAEYAGLRDKISAITARAMNGELDFGQALTERVALLQGLPESALHEVYTQKTTYEPGARELVAFMKKQGAYTLLLSGGFDFFAARVAKELSFDEYRANRLEIREGKLTGRVLAPVLGKEAKRAALAETCVKLNISAAEALAVGDGANDLPMLLAAGLGVAYHAKPAVRQAAKARINYASLDALRWL